MNANQLSRCGVRCAQIRIIIQAALLVLLLAVVYPVLPLCPQAVASARAWGRNWHCEAIRLAARLEQLA